MWAALSSCYYHLHAANISSSREGRQQQQQQIKQQPQPQQPAAAGRSRQQVPRTSTSKKAVGGLTTALGSAVAGAASAVAGAASAVAGASAAALAAATAAGGAAGSGPTAAITRAQDDADGEAVRFTRKFWVRESDVSAVMYYILQHLPLLPSTSHSVAASPGAEHSGDGVSTALGSGQHRRQQQQTKQQSSGPSPASIPTSASQQQQQQRAQQLAGSSTQRQRPQQQQPLLQPALDGFTTTLHTVYFDNPALQLYHGRLYLRPQTQTLKARWIGGQGANNSGGSSGSAGSSGVEHHGSGEGYARPDRVVLERKVYREGWRGAQHRVALCMRQFPGPVVVVKHSLFGGAHWLTQSCCTAARGSSDPCAVSGTQTHMMQHTQLQCHQCRLQTKHSLCTSICVQLTSLLVSLLCVPAVPFGSRLFLPPACR